MTKPIRLLGRPIPQKWLEVMEKVWTVYPEAILAGGCMRDLLFGGEVKDLDVFVPWKDSGSQFPGQDMPHLPVDSFDLTQCLGGSEGYGLDDARAEVKAIDTYHYGNVVPMEGFEGWASCFQGDAHVPAIQVIHLDIPEFTVDAVCRRMDFGVCQIGVYRNRFCTGAYASPAAREDASFSVFTLIRCEDEVQAARSLKRAARFQERYPDVQIDTSIADVFVVPFASETTGEFL